MGKSRPIQTRYVKVFGWRKITMLQNHRKIQKSFYTNHIQNILCGLKNGIVDKIINNKLKISTKMCREITAAS